MAGTNPVCLSPVQRILGAVQFAAQKHMTQKRKGMMGEPYINHLLEVAGLIAESSEDLDENLIVAALLHDTVEDTRTTYEEVREKFGDDVAGLVAEVTDDKSLPKATRKQLQIDNAPHKSTRAATIKLADKISNLRAIRRTRLVTGRPTFPNRSERDRVFSRRQSACGPVRDCGACRRHSRR